MPTCGFVYVATGARYVAEARVSAASLRAAMPDAQIALITNLPSEESPGLYTTVLLRTEVQCRPIDKLLAWEAPFERCVFLDTDTYVSGDLSDLFGLLENFDLAAAPETLRGLHYSLPGVPAAFAEFNTGVLAFRRNVVVEAFFKSWWEDYQRLHASHGFVADQPAFRWTAFRSPVRLAPLPSEYHFIALTPNYTMWQVRLLHGRGELAALARELNARLGARAYVPGLGPIAAFQGRKHWIRQLARLLTRGLAILLGSTRWLAPAPPAHWTEEEQRLTAKGGPRP
jgi:hypothetical protein